MVLCWLIHGGVTISFRDTGSPLGHPLLTPQGRYPVFNFVEDDPKHVAMVGRPRSVVAGGGGSRRGVGRILLAYSSSSAA
jgi:hypothetical protein